MQYKDSRNDWGLLLHGLPRSIFLSLSNVRFIASNLHLGIDEATLTAGERVVLDSAHERSGGFRTELIFRNMENGNGAILSDSHTAYILGNPDNALWQQLTDIPHGSLFGRGKVIREFCYKEEYLLMQKDFAFCRSVTPLDAPILSEGLSIKSVETDRELHDFCSLKAAFFFEESGSPSDADALFQSMQKGFQGIKPVVMCQDQRVVGMVSSNLNSRQSAMINMLFIAKEERGKGYGSLLLRWYMAYLLQESSSLCLFYSPDNAPAVKIYEGLGFKKEEGWVLALKQ